MDQEVTLRFCWRRVKDIKQEHGILSDLLIRCISARGGTCTFNSALAITASMRCGVVDVQHEASQSVVTMRPAVVAVLVLLVTLLFCIPRCKADSRTVRHADALTGCDTNLSDAIGSFLQLADLQQQFTTHHNNSVGPSELQHAQSCTVTSGVSTYVSSRWHEAALPKHSTPGKHKALWPLNVRDWWAFGIAVVAIFIAAGGGIGGGGVLVPLFASVLGQS